MPTKYLLPCRCGATLPIELGQAGQSLTCECGEALSAPTMREISRLASVEVAETTRAAARWSGLQGMLFSTGILTVVAALLAAAFFGYGWSQIPILPQPTETHTQEWEEQVLSKTPPDELIEKWHELESHGLGEWYPPEHVLAREMRLEMRRNTIIAFLVAVVGVGLMACSFALKPSATRQAD